MPKLRRKPRVTVGYEFTGQPVEPKHNVEKATSSAVCRDGLGYCSKMHHLAEPGNEHKNTNILANVFGKPEDEVH